MRYSIRSGLGFAVLLTAATLAACTQPQGSSSAPVTAGPGELNVADAAIAGGNPDMALSITQSILKDDPNNVDALIHEGDAYYALQRCPAAMAAYQQALKSNPSATAAQTGLGRCLLKTDPRAAEAAFTAAVQADPGNAAALNDLGISRDMQGNYAGAASAYQRALVADPSMTSAEVNLGLSLALSGNGPAALQYLGPLAMGQNATAKIRGDYAAALIASGRQADARQVLSIDLPPDQVNQAMAGFNALIAGGQPPLAGNAPAPPPTVAAVPAETVSSTTLVSAAAPAPLTPAAPAVSATPPPPATATTVSTTTTVQTADIASASADPNAAYTGPSPIAGAVSSSTGGADSAGQAYVPPPAAAPPISAPPPSRHVKTVMAAAPAPDPVAESTAPSPADTGASSSTMVQLASLNSQADAEQEWHKISSANPSLFGSKQPDIQTATVNGKTFYRLRTGGFSSKAEAAKFCSQVSAAGNTCTIANF